MKIRPVGAELLHADRQTWWNQVTFHNSVNAPENCSCIIYGKNYSSTSLLNTFSNICANNIQIYNSGKIIHTQKSGSKSFEWVVLNQNYAVFIVFLFVFMLLSCLFWLHHRQGLFFMPSGNSDCNIWHMYIFYSTEIKFTVSEYEKFAQ